MLGISVFELMKAYNISFEEAQILEFKIIGTMSLLKKFCPKIYKKCEELNII